MKILLTATRVFHQHTARDHRLSPQDISAFGDIIVSMKSRKPVKVFIPKPLDVFAGKENVAIIGQKSEGGVSIVPIDGAVITGVMEINKKHGTIKLVATGPDSWEATEHR